MLKSSATTDPAAASVPFFLPSARERRSASAGSASPPCPDPAAPGAVSRRPRSVASAVRPIPETPATLSVISPPCAGSGERETVIVGLPGVDQQQEEHARAQGRQERRAPPNRPNQQCPRPGRRAHRTALPSAL